ncbi:MAG: efflux RND transporter periplasmic adaptor subunit [Phycisphaerales bacterium]|nr:efflux RND transporter periplasmic adaptor subunit [Phycisphaerales bacterium]
MRRWIKRLGVVLVLIGVGAFIAYQQLYRPVPVIAAEVTTGDLQIEVTGTGLLDAHLSAVISTKIAGRVASIEVDQNDPVEAGQLVCRLDDSDLHRQVEIGEASVEVARAAIGRAETDIARSEAVFELAQRDAQRIQLASESGAASVSELDTIVQQVKVAEADVARAEAVLVESRNQLAAAERTLDFYLAQLGETVIVSPFAGIVVRRDRDPGDVLVPGSSIVRVIEPEQLWLSAWVDETAIAALEAGQQARVVFRSEPDREYIGRVARVGLEVDPESREFLVDIALEEIPPRWAVGQRAEAYIETEVLPDTIAVPGEFIAARDGRMGTYVLSGGRAEWRACELGKRGRDLVQIWNGMDPGDRVIRPADKGASRSLRPGKRVVVR